MNKTYLVAIEPIVGSKIYGAGTMFIVADNDKAGGGYHAREINHPDAENFPRFEMVYHDGHPYVRDAPEDEAGYVFVSAIDVREFKEIELAVSTANDIVGFDLYHA